jgi:hypothetical protein
MGKPDTRGLVLGCPLALTGFVCLIIISRTLRIPLALTSSSGCFQIATQSLSCAGKFVLSYSPHFVP